MEYYHNALDFEAEEPREDVLETVLQWDFDDNKPAAELTDRVSVSYCLRARAPRPRRTGAVVPAGGLPEEAVEDDTVPC